VQLSLFQTKPPVQKPASPSLAERIRSVLGPRLPDGALETVVDQIQENPVSLKVVRQRTSKAGDFRPAHLNDPSRITVNGNLNPYAFLITLVHELAHHHVNLDYQRALQKFSLRRKTRPLPHGKEWKAAFQRLMQPYLQTGVFPPDLHKILFHHLENPKASSSADHHLSRALKKYDPPDETIRLELLPFDAVFTLHGRRTFQKKEKVRTRYRCICLNTGRIYLVSAGAPVVQV